MEWLNKMNGAIDYIELNINEKIDYAQAASIACCSLSRFQNMFLFITDVTPAEYARRRRMALSANELISSDIKIIDLSFKYGYESPEAFTRSFKAFHGISPSDARKFGKYIDYPRISFHIKITGGHFIMENTTQFEVYKDILVKMEIIELPETLKFAGVTNEGLENFHNIGVYNDKYKPLMADRHTPYTEIGLSSNICRKIWYAFGCQVDSIDNLPDGLIGLDTGLNKFACLTFRVQPGGDLVGGDDGPGDGMKMAGEYLSNVWIPKNKDMMYNYQLNNHYCEILKKEKEYRLANTSAEGLENSYWLSYWIEVYKADISDDPEMCFYLPLK
jgi:AraC-like DNA-binding protein